MMPDLPQPRRRDAEPMRDERRAAAREALARMKGDRGWIARVDDSSLDFLVTELSGQMMQELARRWATLTVGYPTSSDLAEAAERVQLETAVAALDF